MSEDNAKFSMLATGKGNGSSLQIVGLDTNRRFNLAAYLTPTSYQSNGQWAVPFENHLSFQQMQFSAYALAQGNSNLLQLVAVGGPRQQIYLAAYQDAGGNWHGYDNKPLGFPGLIFTSLVLGRREIDNYCGRLNVVGLNTDQRAYYVTYQDQLGNWHVPSEKYGQPLGNPARTYTQLALGHGDHGNLELLGLDTQGKVYLVAYYVGNNDWQLPPQQYSGPLGPSGRNYSAIAVDNGNDFNLEVLGLCPEDQQIYLVSYLDGGGNWHNPPDKYRGPLGPAGRSYRALTTGRGNQGSLQVLGLDAQGDLYLVAYLDHSGNWHNPPDKYIGPLGRSFAAIATGNGAGSYLEVVGLGKDGQPYLVSYLDPSGDWQEGRALLPDLRNKGLLDVKQAFDAVASQGEAGIYSNFPYADTKGTHFQGMARCREFDILTHDRGIISFDNIFVVDRNLKNHQGQSQCVHSFQTPYKDFNHPGGCQVVGDFLAVSAEIEEEEKQGAVFFYYLGAMTDANGPSLLQTRIHRPENRGAGAAGITAIGAGANPVYIVAVYDGRIVTVYRSNGLLLYDQGCKFQELFNVELDKQSYGADNICLVTDIHDRIYLIGFTSKSAESGLGTDIDEDWAELHEVDLDRHQIRLIEQRHMYTHDGGPPYLDHFRFGAGLVINSATRLDFYCSGRNINEWKVGINNFLSRTKGD